MEHGSGNGELMDEAALRVLGGARARGYAMGVALGLAWLLLYGGGVDAQQVGGTSGSDKLALLALKSEWQGGTGASLLSTWSTLAEPCDSSSWADHWSGWLGVACDRDGGRVAFISLSDAGVGGPVRAFAQLSALRALDLANNVRVTGNVDSLAALSELRELDLSGTSVHGSVESLAGLIHLGEAYSVPATGDLAAGGSTATRPGGLRLGGTNVYGSVLPLRNSTALGEDWGTAQNAVAPFDACAAFNQTCSAGAAERVTVVLQLILLSTLNADFGATGATLVPNASDFTGQDECACCESSQGSGGRLSYERDDRSGICSVRCDVSCHFMG